MSIRKQRAKSERLKDAWKRKYRVKDKEVKYSLRTDKRNYLAKDAEEAANRGEQGTLYALTKRMTNSKYEKECTRGVERRKEGNH